MLFLFVDVVVDNIVVLTSSMQHAIAGLPASLSDCQFDYFVRSFHPSCVSVVAYLSVGVLFVYFVCLFCLSVCSFVRLFLRSFVRSFVCLLVHLFVRSLDCTFMFCPFICFYLLVFLALFFSVMFFSSFRRWHTTTSGSTVYAKPLLTMQYTSWLTYSIAST